MIKADAVTWHSLHGLAVRHKVRGRPAQAIPLMEQAIAMTRGVPKLAEDTGTMLNYLAVICLDQGLLNQAEAAIREALTLSGGVPIFHACDMLVLAKILHQQGRQPEAEAAGQEGIRLTIQEHGRDDSCTIEVEKSMRAIGITERHGWFAYVIPPLIVSLFHRLRHCILERTRAHAPHSKATAD